MVTARASGKRVEDESQRTEFTRVYANPDGTWTNETASGPESVRDDSGEWQDIDTSLVERDGALVPRAVGTNLELSDGGDRVFASMSREGHDLGWRWDAPLPEPVIDGATATYPDVVEGGDLVVTATPSGFTHSVVLRERPEEPVEITIPVATDGGDLVEGADGQLEITKPNGTGSLLTAPAPVMWDASQAVDSVPVESEPSGEALLVDTAVGETAAGTPELTLTPDAGFLSDPETVYPVTIDPAFSMYTSGDTWVSNKTPSSQEASSELRVGTQDGGTTKSRSYVRFNGLLGSIPGGADVKAASLVMRNFDSLSCTSSSIEVAQVASDWTLSGLNWTALPTMTALHQATYDPAKGFSSACPGGDAVWDVTGIVNDWNTGATVNRGLRIKANDETVNKSYRRYRSSDYATTIPYTTPYMNVTYNRLPGVAGVPTVAPLKSYTPPGGPTTYYSKSSTPSFTSSAPDADGDTIGLLFRVYGAPGAGWSTACQTPAVSQGAPTSCTAPDALADRSWSVRAKAGDYYNWSGGSPDSEAGWGPYFTFVVDTTPPPAPTVTADHATETLWGDTPPATNTFTIDAPSDDTVSFEYSKDGSLPASLTPTNARASLAWNPGPGKHTLKVRAIDRAGNEGAWKVFDWGVGGGTVQYVPLQPARIVDTTSGLGITRALSAGQSATFPALGVGGIPSSGVSAVVLSVSAISPTANTALTVWQAGDTRPANGQVVAPAGIHSLNLVTVQPNTRGELSVYNSNGTSAVQVDVQGYYLVPDSAAAGSTFFPLDQANVVDSRSGRGTTQAPWTSGSTRSVQLAGLGGIPATDVSAVVVNVTAFNPTANTFVTVWPSGARPDATVLLAPQGVSTAGQAVVKLDASGRASVYVGGGSADLALDVQGYFTAPTGAAIGSKYVAMSPRRVFNSAGTPQPLTARPISGGGYETVQVTGTGGIPLSDVNAVSLVVTATAAPGATGELSGYATPWQGHDAPSGADILIRPGKATANALVTAVSPAGTIDLRFAGTGSVDIAVDVYGYYKGPTVPLAPVNVRGVLGKGGAVVSWDHPASDGRSPISGYRIAVEPGARTVDVDGNRRAGRVTGLTDGQAYSFTVSALNSYGEGARSTATAPATSQGVQPPQLSSDVYPSKATVQEVSDDQAMPSFAWLDPNTNTQSYEVSKDGSVSTQAADADPSVAWYPSAGDHTLKVRSVTSAGTSPWAVYEFHVVARQVPTVPTNLQSVATDDGATNLSGVVSAPDRGAVEARFYAVHADGTDVRDSPYAVDDLESSGNRAVVTLDDPSLQPGETVTWWMTACVTTSSGWNCGGESVHRTAVVPTPPPAPTTTAATIGASAMTTRAVAESGCATQPCAPSQDGIVLGAEGATTYSALLGFDLSAIPANSRIFDAKLHLHAASGASETLEADQMTADWDQSTAVGDIVEAASDAIWQGSPDTSGDLDLDLTNIVGFWVAGDAPSEGIRLRNTGTGQVALSGLTDATAGNRPRLEVSYLPPGPPTPIRSLRATVGDHGARLTWQPPVDLGAASEIDHYHLEVVDGADTSVLQRDVTSAGATVAGLQNGQAYRATVTAVTQVGTSTPTRISFDPVSVPKAQEALAAVEAYLAARNRLETSDATSAADAVAGGGYAASISALLAAEAPGVVAETGLVVQQGSQPQASNSTVPHLEDSLVTQDGDLIQVVGFVTTITRMSGDNGDVVDEQSRREATFQFKVEGNGTLVLASTTEPDQDVVPTDSVEVDEDSAELDEVPDPNEAPTGFGPAKPRIGGVGRTVDVGSGAARRSEMVKWALKHFDDNHEFKPNCTNFVSRAIHYGGQFPMIQRYHKYFFPKRDGRNWYKTYTTTRDFMGKEHTYMHASYTWGGSKNLHNFLNNHGHLIKEFPDAVPGDVVFYQYKKGGDWHYHTSMVSKVANDGDNPNNFYVTQSNDDYRFRAFADQRAAYKADHVTDLGIFVIRIDSIK